MIARVANLATFHREEAKNMSWLDWKTTTLSRLPIETLVSQSSQIGIVPVLRSCFAQGPVKSQMKLRLKRRSICVLCAVSKETSGFICRQFVSMGSVRCRRQEATRRPSAVSSAHNRCGAEGERVFKVGTNTTCASALSLPACCKPKINKALLVLLTNSAQRTKEYSKRPPIFPKGGQIYAAAAAHSFHFTVLQRPPHSKYKKKHFTF